MLHINQLSINDKGFVNFKNKNWSANGDKSSWAQVRGNVLVINIATKGTITSDFEAELIELLSAYGIDSLYGMLGRHEFALDLSEEVVEEMNEVEEVISEVVEEVVEESYYMNIETGSVQTLQGWLDDYNSMDAEQWGSEDFDDNNNLVEVVKDEEGNWIEKT